MSATTTVAATAAASAAKLEVKTRGNYSDLRPLRDGLAKTGNALRMQCMASLPCTDLIRLTMYA